MALTITMTAFATLASAALLGSPRSEPLTDPASYPQPDYRPLTSCQMSMMLIRRVPASSTR